MSFWTSPHNGGIKVLLLIIAISVVGAFVYQASHTETAMTGEVATRTVAVSGMKNVPSRSEDEVATKRCDRSVTNVLNISAAPVLAATTLTFGSVANDIGHFTLANPTPCPMAVTAMRFSMQTTYPVSATWAPIQNVMLVHAGMQIGSIQTLPDTDPSRSLTFSFPSGVTIPPFGSEVFTVVADSRNVPPPGTLALQLYQFKATNTVTGAPYLWSYPLTLLMVIANPLTMSY